MPDVLEKLFFQWDFQSLQKELDGKISVKIYERNSVLCEWFYGIKIFHLCVYLQLISGEDLEVVSKTWYFIQLLLIVQPIKNALCPFD